MCFRVVASTSNTPRYDIVPAIFFIFHAIICAEAIIPLGKHLFKLLQEASTAIKTHTPFLDNPTHPSSWLFVQQSQTSSDALTKAHLREASFPDDAMAVLGLVVDSTEDSRYRVHYSINSLPLHRMHLCPSHLLVLLRQQVIQLGRLLSVLCGQDTTKGLASDALSFLSSHLCSPEIHFIWPNLSLVAGVYSTSESCRAHAWLSVMESRIVATPLPPAQKYLTTALEALSRNLNDQSFRRVFVERSKGIAHLPVAPNLLLTSLIALVSNATDPSVPVGTLLSMMKRVKC